MVSTFSSTSLQKKRTSVFLKKCLCVSRFVVSLTSALLSSSPLKRHNRVRNPQSGPESVYHPRHCALSTLTHFISKVKALHSHLPNDALAVQWTVSLAFGCQQSVSLGVGHMSPAQRAVRRGATPRESMPPWISRVHNSNGESVWVCVWQCFLWLQLVMHTHWGH